MANVVHLNEKWFYLTKLRRRFLVWHDETILPRYIQSKAHITKVIFLVAVARPRPGWDGKVGCWEIVERTTAARSSVNRPAGTVVLRCVNVTRDVYRDLLVNKVLPAIKEKWPTANELVYLQQDNARPHISPEDAAFAAAACVGGWDIRILNQPPKSPVLNVLDLGFFNSIQALQQSLECQTMDELIAAVKSAFDLLAPSTLERTFATLRRVMNIIDCGGDNRYKIPRSKTSCEDEMALDMMSTRLEEEERLEEVADLLGHMRIND
ncbi:hypothetical protein H310_09675 [Aphanomyces invadans]|uniref:Tc1-like transposase DDE domain-containing protein n=1 Tax=Aphanomyces invadans TaxID=157072 RepID=A0A024TUN8_9STRA|nr:hypothetical protein H310_09675 [Aphanomyces invadans]ETV97336.1 hypothetical protein H310_09675 [Aphanomyces invadans]|eukprot:XP_008874044.1 hypothetical protein H310_09675 [Aphanomyces invadans]